MAVKKAGRSVVEWAVPMVGPWAVLKVAPTEQKWVALKVACWDFLRAAWKAESMAGRWAVLMVFVRVVQLVACWDID
jgi:hypothetical protein